MSGLHINVAKSTVFAAGRDKPVLECEAGLIGISVSALPIKYMGLPLSKNIMTKSDYEPPVVKIRNIFLSWTSKSLSLCWEISTY